MEHPDITAALATGYPLPRLPFRRLRCVLCESGIYEGEAYLELCGKVFCRECAQAGVRYG